MGVTQGWGGAVARFLTTNEGTNGLVGLARTRWDGQVSDAKKRIEAIELRLTDRERNLRAQFTAMETAIATMNQLSQSLGFTTSQ
jgi:flagellar capping protein FliD